MVRAGAGTRLAAGVLALALFLLARLILCDFARRLLAPLGGRHRLRTLAVLWTLGQLILVATRRLGILEVPAFWSAGCDVLSLVLLTDCDLSPAFFWPLGEAFASGCDAESEGFLSPGWSFAPFLGHVRCCSAPDGCPVFARTYRRRTSRPRRLLLLGTTRLALLLTAPG